MWPKPRREEGTRGAALLERYGGLVGDKRWYYAEVLSFTCSIVVGVAEGMPSDRRYCWPRAAVAMIFVIVQCVCGCTTLVRYELVLQLVAAACVIPMSVLAVCVSSGFVGEDVLYAMSLLAMAANIIGIVQMLCQAIAGVVSMSIGTKELCFPFQCVSDGQLANGLSGLTAEVSACELAACPLLLARTEVDRSSTMPVVEHAPYVPDLTQISPGVQSKGVCAGQQDLSGCNASSTRSHAVTNACRPSPDTVMRESAIIESVLAAVEEAEKRASRHKVGHYQKDDDEEELGDLYQPQRHAKATDYFPQAKKGTRMPMSAHRLTL